MDEKALAALGLKPKEVAVYNAVLKAGKASPVVLGKLAGIQRTTAYSIAKGLAEKGFLTEDSTRRPRTFSLSSPEEVLGLIEREKQLVAERETTLKAFANELSKISSSTVYPVPTVRFIEDQKIAGFLREQTPIWNTSALSANEPTWWGFQDHTFVENYSEWLEWFWTTTSDDIDLKLLSNRTESEVKFAQTIKAERRKIKYWGEATDFLSTTWIVGDYLVMINTRTKPFYAVEIHDKLMAHDQREVFKNLWPLV